MKPQDKVLTYAQAKELKWFSKNCVGLRTEYYELMDKFLAFQHKLDRLNSTCELIEKFFGDQLKDEPENETISSPKSVVIA
jgi:hypothetical protein